VWTTAKKILYIILSAAGKNREDLKMKILIVFATRYGTTGKCANKLGDILKSKGHDVDIVDLMKDRKVDPGNYDIAVIGGSFMMFRMNSIVKKYVRRNLKTLLDMKTGVFMCGADDDWEKEIKKGFPKEILDKASAISSFGYEMLWDRMSPFFRNMLQQQYKSDGNISRIKENNIKIFAEALVRA